MRVLTMLLLLLLLLMLYDVDDGMVSRWVLQCPRSPAGLLQVSVVRHRSPRRLRLIPRLHSARIARCKHASINSAFYPSTAGKSTTDLPGGIKAGHVHLCRVAGSTVRSRSSEMGFHEEP